MATASLPFSPPSLSLPTRRSRSRHRHLHFPSPSPRRLHLATPDNSTDSPTDPNPVPSPDVEEIKAKLAAAREDRGFWSGVAEEVREIEWPALRKVVGTTGVVVAVIAGSSVALLTVNAVLAEISDRVFAGRGVQDFF